MRAGCVLLLLVLPCALGAATPSLRHVPASLVTLEDGTLTAEMVLHAGDQHVYDAVRQPRSNLHLLWHHLTITVTEKEDSCALQVSLQEEGVKPARATNAVRTGNTTVVVESPFGAPLHVLVQCAPIADGFTAYMARGEAWYNLTLSTELQPRYPVLTLLGVVLLLTAPRLATSASAFYAGGVTLSFIALSLVILYQVSRKLPGGKKLGGVFMLVYSVFPEWRERMTVQYLGSLMWPFKQLWRYSAHPDPSSMTPDELLSTAAAVGWLGVSATVGYFGVRWFAIDKATGGVEAAAGKFVLWSLRVGAVLGPLFYGAGRDPQLRVTLVALVWGAFTLPWVLATLLCAARRVQRVVYWPVRVLFSPLWTLVRLVAWSCGKPIPREGLYRAVRGNTEVEGHDDVMEAPGLAPGTPGYPSPHRYTYETPPPQPRSTQRKSRLGSAAAYSGGRGTHTGTPGGSGRGNGFPGGYSASPMRKDGSNMDDPSSAVPARPLTRMGTPQPGYAAAATGGRWLSPQEADAKMKETTQAALASLTDSPQFKEWMRNSHAGMRVEDDHADSDCELSDEIASSDEDDDPVGVRRGPAPSGGLLAGMR